MDSGNGVTGGTNRLLDALSAAQCDGLRSSLTRVSLEPKTVLFERGDMIDVVDFPGTCVISLVTPFRNGGIVEVASVGNEGIVGVPMVLGGSLAVRAICSIGGWVDRMAASNFIDEIENDLHLRGVVDDYLRAVFGALSQGVACNRVHSTTERLVRWLLASDDRTHSDGFRIDPEFMSQLLGSSEFTVSRSVRHLGAVGLIGNQRGWVTIIDRFGLESIACECYAVIKADMNGVVQRAAVRFGGAQVATVRD